MSWYVPVLVGPSRCPAGQSVLGRSSIGRPGIRLAVRFDAEGGPTSTVLLTLLQPPSGAFPGFKVVLVAGIEVQAIPQLLHVSEKIHLPYNSKLVRILEEKISPSKLLQL